MRKFILTFVAVMAAATIAASAFAFSPGWGRGHGGCPYYDRGIDQTPAVAQLGLTVEQTEMIKALREAHLKDIKPLQEKMFSKRGDLRLLWLQANPDQDKILALQKEIRSLRDQMDDKRVSHRLAVLKVLTPEQQAKAQAYGAGRGFGGGPCIGGPGGGQGFGPGLGPRGNW
jgi:Spy/CpxP family protein refolding chaperone